jgi:hypothetical protein
MIYKIFKIEDQNWFSKISGDYNPIHLDDLYARKSMFGEIIVHGIHLVIWSLDEFSKCCKSSCSIISIDCNFTKPVKLNQKIVLETTFYESNKCKISLIVDNVLVTKINIQYQSETTEFDNIYIDENPEKEDIYDGDFTFCKNTLQLKYLNTDIFRRYPNLNKVISANQVLNFLTTTKIVGMKCPGLNSIYSGFNFKLNNKNNPTYLTYSIEKRSLKYHKFDLHIESESINGKIIAFDRPKLNKIFSYIDATQIVDFGNFSNQRALIIGGSRGVGAICSKLLIAGGAKVLFTYNQGLMEANEICSEINSPNLNSIQYDINNVKNDTTKSIREFAPTHIYYFVTPFIFSANKGHFDIKLFQKFSNYYLDGLYRIVSSFERNEELKLYYPSSIAIDELLDNMIEYSCSKIAGELLCDHLEKLYPKLQVYKPRLPRLETEQTLSLIKINNIKTEKIILDSLQKFSKL